MSSDRRSPVRILPAPLGSRVATGAVQFGDDWPGLFIRGDDCIALSLALPRLRKLVEALPPAERLSLDPVMAVLGRAKEPRQGPPRLSAKD